MRAQPEIDKPIHLLRPRCVLNPCRVRVSAHDRRNVPLDRRLWPARRPLLYDERRVTEAKRAPAIEATELVTADTLLRRLDLDRLVVKLGKQTERLSVGEQPRAEVTRTDRGCRA